MGIEKIFSYLVAPGKNEPKPPALSAVEIPLDGRLFQMLARIYQAAPQECDTPIGFVSKDGQQVNDVRTSVLEFMKKPTIDTGKVLATRLRDCTTHRSKLGLLFLSTGSEARTKKIVISRFPAVEGVLAEPDADSLEVQFHERVFLKSAFSYKAAHYEGISFDADFWDGAIIDRQINDPSRTTADYWIKEFLDSDLLTTSREGSRRLARCVRVAIKKVKSPEARLDLAYVATKAGRLDHQRLSVADVADKFDLGKEARDALFDALPSKAVLEDKFTFNLEEFAKLARYRADEFDNGGVVVAPASQFDEIVKREEIDPEEKRYRYSLEGKVVDERISSRKT